MPVAAGAPGDDSYRDEKEALLRAIAADPNNVSARHRLALLIGFEGDFEASAAALSQLIEQFPQNLEARYDLGMTQLMLGRYEEACANFRHILSIDPTHEKARQQAVHC